MLEGKRIIVTGASRGLGRALALCFAQYGATVGINYHRSKEAADALLAEIKEKTRGDGRLMRFNVQNREAMSSAIQVFHNQEKRVDALVNNAAILHPGLLITHPDDKIEDQIKVNFLAPILAIRAVLPFMLEQKSGVILNIGSVVSQRPYRGQVVYAATKGALESMTRALAVEYARKGIRAYCLRPGAIDTEMLTPTQIINKAELVSRIPMQRIGRPETVAEMAAFLISDRSEYSTGGCYDAGGGYLVG